MRPISAIKQAMPSARCSPSLRTRALFGLPPCVEGDIKKASSAIARLRNAQRDVGKIKKYYFGFEQPMQFRRDKYAPPLSCEP
jgi:hypothetical protein